MAIAQYHLHDEINAEEAITLWEASGSGARKASGFTYKGDKIIARHDASLTFESFEALVLAADKVIFWLTGFAAGFMVAILVGVK